jgi:NADH dehydrogenase FAD-containing subunit
MTDPGATAPQIRSTDYVRNHDGTVTRYETWNVLWTAGVEAPPLARAVAKATGAQQDRAGRIVVGPDLSGGRGPVRRQPGRFRGDCRAQKAR